MYASRELSFAAVRANSKDSSAQARYSAAVIIFISRSPCCKQLLKRKRVCHSALSSSVCEAQSVTHPSVVPILHFSTRPLCRKSFKRRALKLTVGVETVWRDFEDHGGGKRRGGIHTLSKRQTNKRSLGRLPPEASVLVLRHLTMRCWSQRRTAAPFEPIPTETVVKRLSVPRPRCAAAKVLPRRMSCGSGMCDRGIVNPKTRPKRR
jgi:hypothetical protein